MTVIRFREESGDPRELRVLAEGICKDVFSSGPNSYDSFRLIELGPAYVIEETRSGDGGVVSRLWAQQFVASDEHDRRDELREWFRTRVRDSGGRVDP